MQVRIDEIIRSKRKTLQLSVTSDARVVVRAPMKLSLKRIRQFVEEKSAWIEKNRAAVQQRSTNSFERKFVDGETIFFLGTPYCLSIKDKQSSISIDGDFFFFPGSFMKDPMHHLQEWYKRQAKRYIGDRLAVLSNMMGIDFASYRITGARRRWGSCSSKNRLNFAWRLIQAEPAVIDYVIVHELCHVKIKNHSKAFWGLLERYIPDYRGFRKWLRDHQFLMNI